MHRIASHPLRFRSVILGIDLDKLNGGPRPDEGCYRRRKVIGVEPETVAPNLASENEGALMVTERTSRLKHSRNIGWLVLFLAALAGGFVVYDFWDGYPEPAQSLLAWFP